jgi:preprotein translocase subunit SecG
MGKMIGTVDGADVYLVTSLLIFLFVFVVVALYMTVMSKERCDELSNLPFNQPNENNDEG